MYRFCNGLQVVGSIWLYMRGGIKTIVWLLQTLYVGGVGADGCYNDWLLVGRCRKFFIRFLKIL